MTTLSSIKLPRLNANVAVTDAGDKASVGFANFWNQFATAIETSVNGVIDAQNTASEAQTTANSAAATINLNAAYTVGCTVVAAANGATAKVTISSHTLVYPDKTVSVDAGEVDGLAYNTAWNVYYDDQTRVGGAVSYAAANDSTAFASDTNPYRHFVGTVTAPATSGDPPNTGAGRNPIGYNGEPL